MSVIILMHDKVRSDSVNGVKERWLELREKCDGHQMGRVVGCLGQTSCYLLGFHLNIDGEISFCFLLPTTPGTPSPMATNVGKKCVEKAHEMPL